MSLEFLEAFKRANEVITAQYIDPVPDYIIEQISDKDSSMLSYLVNDHGKPFHGSVVIPNTVLNSLTNHNKAVRDLLDGLIICNCPDGPGRPTSCVINQLFSYQGDPVNYFDPKLGRAVRIQGIDPKSWEMPLPLFQLIEKIKALNNVIYVNSEPHQSDEARGKFRSNVPIALHIGWVDNNGNVPEPSVPISMVVPDYVYMNSDNHHVAIEEAQDWLNQRLENLT